MRHSLFDQSCARSCECSTSQPTLVVGSRDGRRHSIRQPAFGGRSRYAPVDCPSHRHWPCVPARTRAKAEVPVAALQGTAVQGMTICEVVEGVERVVVDTPRGGEHPLSLAGSDGGCGSDAGLPPVASPERAPRGERRNGPVELHEQRPAIVQRTVATLKSALLPTGWPASTTPDYLEYQLWALLSHIAGWMSAALSTSSMLEAVGVGSSAAATVASSAAIKWVTKDGLGAAGRFIVGGRLGRLFDEDPKQLRLQAEAATTLGLALEIATSFFPKSFLVLAGAGTLAKSVGRGLGRPAFRVIQTHFAAHGNVGDIAAKEEVWEVVGQLLGLASSVLLLKSLEDHSSAASILASWTTVQAVHVLLRWKALKVLQLNTINQKRGTLLVLHYLASGNILSVQECNRKEAILQPRDQGELCVAYGESLQNLLQDDSLQLPRLQQLAEAHASMDHLLLWHDSKGVVFLKEDAPGVAMLQAIYQAAWLQQQQVTSAGAADLEASVAAVLQQFAPFLEDCRAAGWLVEDVDIRTLVDVRLRIHTPTTQPAAAAAADDARA